MFRPPPLGVGLVYSSYLHKLLEQPGFVDLVEIEPQALWLQAAPGLCEFRFPETELARLAALPCAKLLHGVGFPVGGSRMPDLAHVPLFNGMADALGSTWVSEHLSFNTFNSGGDILRTGMLMPPLQTPEGIACAVASVRGYGAALNRPMAVETAVNYLKPHPDEMSDGAFISEVAESADCGILLDLHNLWANERNGRQPVRDVIAELPLERVWEVHLAGGEERNGYWIDAHSGALSAEVIALAHDVIPCLPNLGAVVLEIFPTYLAGLKAQDIADEIGRIREIWNLPRHAPRHRTRVFPPAGSVQRAATVAEWERTLGDAVLRRPTAMSAPADDPAIPLYRELLEEFRASMLATTIPLTTRLLLIHLGMPRLRGLFADFWRQSAPELSAAAEGICFVAFLEANPPAVPLLHEIAAYEAATIRAVIEERPQRVYTEGDIRVAIADLQARRIPAPLDGTPYEFVIDPPDEAKLFAQAPYLT